MWAGCCGRRNRSLAVSALRCNSRLIALVYVILGLLEIDDIRRKIVALTIATRRVSRLKKEALRPR